MNPESQSIKRISLWSGPRNVSTAIMYAFAQRHDTRVYDEPLYAHYLSRTGARNYHPGADEILNSQDNDGEQVISRLFLGPSDKPVIFLKSMAHHLVDLDLEFLHSLTNVLLTREPKDMILSYSRTIPSFGMNDLGYEHLSNLADTILEGGHSPIVLDSRILLENPEKILDRLCRRLGIQFDPGMLHWEPGPRPEDGVWAKHWYHNIHRSTGFKAYEPKHHDSFPPSLLPLLKECEGIYARLMEYALV